MKLLVDVSLARIPWCCLILTLGISMAGNTSADTIITGQLTYDSETHLIISSTGNTYLGIEINMVESLPALESARKSMKDFI